jgi:hypothetical protein
MPYPEFPQKSQFITIVVEGRESMKPPAEEIERLRKKLSGLEERERELSNRLYRLTGRIGNVDPELTAFMREGLPLELFTRASLLDNGYEVHSYYLYHLINPDGSKTERSVDIYASGEITFTVPEGEGLMSGKSWPERNSLLVEIKQRRGNVLWLFCLLPTSQKKWSIASDYSAGKQRKVCSSSQPSDMVMKIN